MSVILYLCSISYLPLKDFFLGTKHERWLHIWAHSTLVLEKNLQVGSGGTTMADQ